MKVTIDGVECIPAKKALANEKAIDRGLLMFFWGTCTEKRLEQFTNDPGVRVLVNDYGQGEPLRVVLDEIAKQA